MTYDQNKKERGEEREIEMRRAVIAMLCLSYFNKVR